MQHRASSQVKLFIESCTWIVTSSAPLVSTSNVPFCASLYRPRSTPLGVPLHLQMNPQWRTQLQWQMHPQVHHQVQRQMHPFCYLLMHLQWLFKVLYHSVLSHALTIAWTSAAQVQPEVYFLVKLFKFSFSRNSRCIILCTLNCTYCCSVFTLTNTFNFWLAIFCIHLHP